MFFFAFIVIFLLAGIRAAQHYPTRLKLEYQWSKVEKGEYYRLFTGVFVHPSWMAVVFGVLNIAFVGMSLSNMSNEWLTLAAMAAITIISFFIHHKLSGSDDLYWGSFPLMFGLYACFAVLQPLTDVRLFFILPLKYFLFQIILLVLLIYNEIKNKFPVPTIIIAISLIVGSVTSMLFYYPAIIHNWWMALINITGAGVLLYMQRKGGISFRKKQLGKVIKMTPDQHYNVGRKAEQQKIDDILEKIHQKGINSLSDEEKRMLDDFSNRT